MNTARNPDLGFSILDLLQLSDSAFPIGAQSHSFGLETLVASGAVDAHNLQAFLADYLVEVVEIECIYSRAAYELGVEAWPPDANPVEAGPIWDEESPVTAWLQLNRRLAALRPALETRQAGEVLGRRFLGLVAETSGAATLGRALQAAKAAGVGCQYTVAFGLCGGVLQLGQDAVVLAYAHQAVGTLLAAAQKLMPIGQTAVTRIRWQLGPDLTAVAERSRAGHQQHIWAGGFAPLVELASMRHPALPMRLFIS